MESIALKAARLLAEAMEKQRAARIQERADAAYQTRQRPSLRPIVLSSSSISRSGQQGDNDCPACHGIKFVRTGAPVGDPLFGQLVPCDCNGEYGKREQKRLSAISGQLPGEMELTLADVVGRGADTRRMLEAARQFVAQPSGLLTLWGDWGNGKTLILHAITNELRSRGLVSAYTTFKELIDWVSGGFDDSDGAGNEQRRFAYVKKAQFLALDEVYKTRMTEYRQEFRTAFFDHRYRTACDGETHTVLAMNANPADLPGEIYDRLRQFEIVHNGDKSMRPAMMNAEQEASTQWQDYNGHGNE